MNRNVIIKNKLILIFNAANGSKLSESSCVMVQIENKTNQEKQKRLSSIVQNMNQDKNYIQQIKKNQNLTLEQKMPKKNTKRKQTPNLHETQLYDKVTKLESSILSDLLYLNKKRNLKFDCVHCYDQKQQTYDPKKNYYEEFWKSYMINMVLMKKYEDYRDWMRKMTRKMQNIENTYAERKEAMQPIESRRRKKNSSSESSDLECVQCGKKYKDEDSLNIHLSIKHRTQKLELEVNTSSLLQAKIEQLNHHYIQNSDSEDKKYYQEESEH